jgi:hypothetical protein
VSLDEKDRVMDVARVIADDSDEVEEMEGSPQVAGTDEEPQED